MGFWVVLIVLFVVVIMLIGFEVKLNDMLLVWYLLW